MSTMTMKYYSSCIVGMKPHERSKFLTRLDKRDQTFGDIDFGGVIFHDIDFMAYDFPASSFHGCDLSKAIFCNCIIGGKKFVGANFLGTVFVNCSFYNADVFRKTVHQYGRLVEERIVTEYPYHFTLYNTVIPPTKLEGKFVGYKFLKVLVDTYPLKPAIAELVIPADAKRVVFKSDKCRASKVYVKEIRRLGGNGEVGEQVDVGYSPICYLDCLTYKVGEEVEVDGFDESYAECSSGIHFFLSAREAIEYAMGFKLPRSAGSVSKKKG